MSCCSLPIARAHRESAHEARSPNAGPTCQAAECAGGRTTPQSTTEGRNPHMAKKAKGGKKKAAKKR